MAKRGRKPQDKQEKAAQVIKSLGIRFCYSHGAVFINDGMCRWWKEFDDSGYNWDGTFEILGLDQVRERITMCRTLGISVYEKVEPTDDPKGFDYELRLPEDVRRAEF